MSGFAEIVRQGSLRFVVNSIGFFIRFVAIVSRARDSHPFMPSKLFARRIGYYSSKRLLPKKLALFCAHQNLAVRCRSDKKIKKPRKTKAFLLNPQMLANIGKFGK
jgi:hypothetical protein